MTTTTTIRKNIHASLEKKNVYIIRIRSDSVKIFVEFIKFFITIIGRYLRKKTV